MKKTFLCFCFFMLFAKQALAITTKAELKIRAVLTFTEALSCSNSAIDLNNFEFDVANNASETSFNVTNSVDTDSNMQMANCTKSNLDWTYPETLTVSNDDNQAINISNVNLENNNKLSGMVNITNDTASGKYVGILPVMGIQ